MARLPKRQQHPWPRGLRAIFVCYVIGLLAGTAQLVEALSRCHWDGYQTYLIVAWTLMAAGVASGVLGKRRVFAALVVMSSALNLSMTWEYAVDSLGVLFGDGHSCMLVALWNIMALAANAAFAGYVLFSERPWRGTPPSV